MTSNTKNILSFHRANLIIWSAILSGIVILVIVISVLDSLEFILATETAAYVEKILFLIAIALALMVIIFKRSIFLPANLVNSVRSAVEPDKEKALFDKIRRNYIIIWVLAESICIIGIIDYLLFVQLNSFLIYSVVSIYSLLINIPRQSKVEKCFELLDTTQ